MTIYCTETTDTIAPPVTPQKLAAQLIERIDKDSQGTAQTAALAILAEMESRYGISAWSLAVQESKKDWRRAVQHATARNFVPVSELFLGNAAACEAICKIAKVCLMPDLAEAAEARGREYLSLLHPSFRGDWVWSA